jgi:hypothetical protein
MADLLDRVPTSFTSSRVPERTRNVDRPVVVVIHEGDAGTVGLDDEPLDVEAPVNGGYFFLGGQRRNRVVTVPVGADNRGLRLGKPHQLFVQSMGAGIGFGLRRYDVTPDGRHFVFGTPTRRCQPRRSGWCSTGARNSLGRWHGSARAFQSVFRNAIKARLSSADSSSPNSCPFTARVFTP